MYELTTTKQTMTSREIAEHTGKNHKDILRAIRGMAPAWEKVNGRKFALVEYIDKQGKKRPQYELTKSECLYITTKFNCQAVLKMFLLWDQLERFNLIDLNNPGIILQFSKK